MEPNPDLVERIDALLPQTQCGQCGYDGCRPYARALATGGTDLNRCPPGGQAGIQALAELLEWPVKPLDPSCGEHHEPPRIAVIDESACIGCVRCIKACPVDAIAGAAKRMHTVIASECTGCELCVPACPVDCIDLVPATARAGENRDERNVRAHKARRRFDARNQRLSMQEASRTRRVQPGAQSRQEDKQAAIAAAMARSNKGKATQRTNAVNKAIERARAQRRSARGKSREQG